MLIIHHHSIFSFGFPFSDRVDPFHRKIVIYVSTRGKTYDHPSGHGTHTACSIAGSVEIDNRTDGFGQDHDLHDMARYNGIAPHARLAVFDFNDGQTQGKIKPPKDIYGQYFRRAYHEAGARISSNS